MTYEIKKYGTDPLSIARGQCKNLPLWWESITMDELRKLHKDELAEEAALPDEAIEYMDYRGVWYPASPNFDEWLRERVAEGRYIRVSTGGWVGRE